MKLRCQFRGKGGKRCRRQFERKPRGTRRIHCFFHQVATERRNARARKKREYAKNPEKFRKRSRKYSPSTYRDSEPEKYRKMQDDINARQRNWRKKNPKRSAALSAAYRKRHPQKAKESQAAYHKRLRELVALGRQFQAGIIIPQKNGDRGSRPIGRPSRTELFNRAKELHSQGRSWPQCAESLIPEEAKENRHAASERLRVGVAGLKNLKRRATP